MCCQLSAKLFGLLDGILENLRSYDVFIFIDIMISLKKVAKNLIGNAFSSIDCPVVVNSFGRSGSTVLVDSIVDGVVRVRNSRIRSIVKRSVSIPAWSLENTRLHRGIVYKTHDYPPSCYLKKGVRMIYTFSNPLDVVLSLLRLWEDLGDGWMESHYKHLGVEYTVAFSEIVNQDRLMLEKHLDAWLGERRIPIAFVRYETMWKNQKKISDFLGSKVELPMWRERKPKEVSRDLVKSILNTYKPLQDKIDGLSDFFVYE